MALEGNLEYLRTLPDRKVHAEAVAAVAADADPGDIRQKSCHLEEYSCQIEYVHKRAQKIYPLRPLQRWLLQ